MSRALPGSIRKRVYRTKGDACHFCAAAESLEVHHIDGDASNHDLDNLLPVCRDCHMNIHYPDSDEFRAWNDKILPRDERIFAQTVSRYAASTCTSAPSAILRCLRKENQTTARSAIQTVLWRSTPIARLTTCSDRRLCKNSGVVGVAPTGYEPAHTPRSDRDSSPWPLGSI